MVMRKLPLIALLVFALSVGFSSPARATAPTEYFTTYTVVNGNSALVRQAHDNSFYTSSAQAVLTGDIVGSATETEHDTIHADGTDNFKGMFICTCTVANRSGTFTVQYTGIGAADGTFAGQNVVVGGTLGLATLRGNGTFQNCGDVACAELFLHFDP
jgi:hypothetical protein